MPKAARILTLPSKAPKEEAVPYSERLVLQAIQQLRQAVRGGDKSSIRAATESVLDAACAAAAIEVGEQQL